MAILQVPSKFSSFSSSYGGSKRTIAANINVPNILVAQISAPKLPTKSLMAELDYIKHYKTSTATNTIITQDPYLSSISTKCSKPFSSKNTQNAMEISKLHLIMEIVADRVEMHKNIGSQRDNWNRLLLTSINMITLSAATMAGIAAMSSSQAPLVALKVSSTILYMAATGILVVMNKIQPSQLVEEQRNAARLFKQLHGELKTKLSLGDFNMNDVDEAIEKVLALDKAFPLPLLGVMLDKFPKNVEPAVWWPQKKQRHQKSITREGNGWDARLEGEMKEIVRILQKKDMAEYLRLSKKALNLNKILAVSGPVLTGLAALGSALVGCGNLGNWGVLFGVIGGALASVVNTIEHGGQVGMVFDMYRGSAGVFKLMEETIEFNLSERDREKRENGELLETKVALQLGRSLSELRQLAALSSSDEEFASKLF